MKYETRRKKARKFFLSRVYGSTSRQEHRLESTGRNIYSSGFPYHISEREMLEEQGKLLCNIADDVAKIFQILNAGCPSQDHREVLNKCLDEEVDRYLLEEDKRRDERKAKRTARKLKKEE